MSGDAAATADHEGPLPGANATGRAGPVDSAPGLTLRLRIDLDGTIRAARFELLCFDAARAAAAALCEALHGARAADAARTSARAIARLAGLREGHVTARAVHAALRDALRAWCTDAAPRTRPVVCACFGLGADEIVHAITIAGARSLDALRDHVRATQGCGTCRPDVEALLRAHAPPD